MPSRPKMTAAVTVIALGAMTAFAIDAGNDAASEQKPTGKAAGSAPVVNTVVVRRTIPTKEERRRAARVRAARRKAVERHRIAIAKLLGRPIPLDRKAQRRAAQRRRRAIARHRRAIARYRKAIASHRRTLAKLLEQQEQAAQKSG